MTNLTFLDSDDFDLDAMVAQRKARKFLAWYDFNEAAALRLLSGPGQSGPGIRSVIASKQLADVGLFTGPSATDDYTDLGRAVRAEYIAQNPAWAKFVGARK